MDTSKGECPMCGYSPIKSSAPAENVRQGAVLRLVRDETAAKAEVIWRMVEQGIAPGQSHG